MKSLFYSMTESLLMSEYGVDEESYELLCKTAHAFGESDALELLQRADATDGMYYITDGSI